MAGLGYDVDLAALAKVAVPTALVAIVASIIYFIVKDKMLGKKYYK